LGGKIIPPISALTGQGMRYRKLRIAWSVLSGVAAVLLVILWVRSYRWTEGFVMPISKNRIVTTGSGPGVVGIGTASSTLPRSYYKTSFDNYDKIAVRRNLKYPSQLWGGVEKSPVGASLFIPYWFLTCAAIASGVLTWNRRLVWRFNVRTLLIVTTLFALVLGLIVWAAR
jgi:hypothetical protein